MSVFVKYGDFLKEHGAKKVVGYKVEEMDIVKAKSAMNEKGEVFFVGDRIRKSGSMFEIVAFAGRDDAYLGAIAKCNDVFQYIDLYSAENFGKRIVFQMKSFLKNNGFDLSLQSGNRIEKGNVFITFTCDGLANVWVYTSDTSFKLLLKDLTYELLKSVVRHLNEKDVWYKFGKEEAVEKISFDKFIAKVMKVLNGNKREVLLKNVYFSLDSDKAMLGDVVKGCVIRYKKKDYFLEVYKYADEFYACLTHYYLNDTNIKYDIKCKIKGTNAVRIINALDRYLEENVRESM